MKTSSSNILKLDIGGIPILIHSDDPEFITKKRDSYSNFICEESNPSLKIEVELKSFNSDYDGFENPIVSIDKSKGIYTLKGFRTYGEFNVRNMEGNLMHGSPASLNLFLGFIYSILLLKEPGFLVHAAGLIRNGKGYIFPGKSEAGKTTIAKLSPDAELLTDEVALVKKVDGSFQVFGTPFKGQMDKIGQNLHIPLKAVYFPQKDKKVFKRSIGSLDALKMMLTTVVFYSEDEEFIEQLFNICVEFVNSVPCHELHFLPEPSFWKVIDVAGL